MARIITRICGFSFLLSLVLAQSADVSTDGFCSSLSSVNATCANSTYGNCCSTKGYCGTTTEYCGAGCQSAFGACFANADRISGDGFCAGSKGQICLGSIFGNCCSANGYCGNGTTYCGTGCQSAFGSCGENAALPATTTSSSFTEATPPTSTSSAASQASSLASTSPSSTGDSSSGTNAGAIAGGVVGGVLFIALLMGLAIWLRRRRRTGKRMARSEAAAGPYEAPSSVPTTYSNDKPSGLIEMPFHHERLQELHGDSTKSNAFYEADSAKIPVEKQPMDHALVDDRASKGYDGAYRGN